MQKLTDAGENLVNDVSSRYGLSRDAVVYMLVAVNNGGGGMAQFNCPELGGSGQWMRGGMTMVGDMFNHGLKSTVDNLCNELSGILANNQVFPIIPAGTPGSNQWWPAGLGAPFSSGSQNNIRYAVFPNRLAVELNGQVSLYDTLNNHISGVSQQQGGNSSLTFSSQFGTIAVNTLPLVSGPGLLQPAQTNFAAPEPTPVSNHNYQHPPMAKEVQNTEPLFTPAVSSAPNKGSTSEVNATLELLGKLAQLRDSGALTDEEFNSTKAELLKRI
jgi:hypothetical protein